MINTEMEHAFGIGPFEGISHAVRRCVDGQPVEIFFEHFDKDEKLVRTEDVTPTFAFSQFAGHLPGFDLRDDFEEHFILLPAT